MFMCRSQLRSTTCAVMIALLVACVAFVMYGGMSTMSDNDDAAGEYVGATAGTCEFSDQATVVKKSEKTISLAMLPESSRSALPAEVCGLQPSSAFSSPEPPPLEVTPLRI